MSLDFLLELDNVSCGYGQQIIVHDFTLRLRKGSISCLLGPSGCGKTTVLRAIAGFQPLQQGEIRIREQVVATVAGGIAPERRRLGMVFQDYALFPHLSVLANVSFGLRKRRSKAQKQQALAMLELVGLADRANDYPHQLSGGQQQRVALARALAPEPDLVLLDEPFSSLDVALRERLSYEVHDILKKRGVTALMVTHDQMEAFAVGEQIGVIQAGQLQQWDTPYQLYHEPINRFVATFIGKGRFVPATLTTPDTLATDFATIRGNRAYLWSPGTRVEVLLRPDDVVPDSTGALSATIVNKAFKGAETLYTLRLTGGAELLSLFPSHLDHAVGDTVTVSIDAEHLVAFAVGPH